MTQDHPVTNDADVVEAPAPYEPPTVEFLGTLEVLTRGQGGAGTDFGSEISAV